MDPAEDLAPGAAAFSAGSVPSKSSQATDAGEEGMDPAEDAAPGAAGPDEAGTSVDESSPRRRTSEDVRRGGRTPGAAIPPPSAADVLVPYPADFLQRRYTVFYQSREGSFAHNGTGIRHAAFISRAGHNESNVSVSVTKSKRGSYIYAVVKSERLAGSSMSLAGMIGEWWEGGREGGRWGGRWRGRWRGR